MAAAAGTALFRSMASKMARAPPPHRVIPVRGLHGGPSSGAGAGAGAGRSSANPSHLSTSSGSSAASSEDLAARDQEVLRQARDIVADPEFMKGTIDQINAATGTCLTAFVFGASLFYTFVKPTLNRLEDRTNALSRQVVYLKQKLVKMKNIKDDGHKANIYEAQSMETSGPKST